MLRSVRLKKVRNNVKVAKRVEDLPPYLFVEISKKKAAKRAEGVKLADFGIGDPDLPTPDHILNELHSCLLYTSDAADE